MLGVKSPKDRDFIKTKIKELKIDDKKRIKQILVEQNAKKKKLKS